MSKELAGLMGALNAAHDPVDKGRLMDEIEAIIMTDPEGSRATVLAYEGDEGLRLRALGEVGDPADFDLIAEALADPALRETALEALAGQPDAGGVDALARSYLDDPAPAVRSRAAGLVAFHGRPGAVEALLPSPRTRSRMCV
ncbi:HEAT repeat domain-containing protein [Actinomadura nitritigenes]|uniref:HEAT repeat domain-containing protein n=1 Tax=Actinomadura nitritigenes TaxID=134602 RepID=UPI003D905A3D